MKKIIKIGKLEGLSIMTEQDIENNNRQNEIAQDVSIPVVIMKPMQQNCKGGDIDACQNFGWCAECVDRSREESNPVKKIVIGAAFNKKKYDLARVV